MSLTFQDGFVDMREGAKERFNNRPVFQLQVGPADTFVCQSKRKFTTW